MGLKIPKKTDRDALRLKAIRPRIDPRRRGLVDGQSTEGITLQEYCSISANAPFATITTVDGETYETGPVEDYWAFLEG